MPTNTVLLDCASSETPLFYLTERETLRGALLLDENQHCVHLYTIRIERFLSAVLEYRAPSPEDFPNWTVLQYWYGK